MQRDRLLVTFVCPDCGVQNDKALTRARYARPFPCAGPTCSHRFLPPADFWETAVAMLEPAAGRTR